MAVLQPAHDPSPGGIRDLGIDLGVPDVAVAEMVLDIGNILAGV
jgi:hypothetical protein